ncbi:hypothetical protein NMG60_11013704 [Bertholletia excelsa]
MNALDSPLEALVFGYLSLGFLNSVNNIWAWIAVVTAAVSFWSIKAAGACTLKSDCLRGTIPDESPTKSPVSSSSPDTAVKCEPAPTASTSMATTSTSVPSFPSTELTTEGTTKGKFTACYVVDKQEEESDSGAVEVNDVGGICDIWMVGGGDIAFRWEGCREWERIIMLRKEIEDEMGWYAYQDLRVVDGSVVRLWDDSRRLDKYSLLLARVM